MLRSTIRNGDDKRLAVGSQMFHFMLQELVQSAIHSSNASILSQHDFSRIQCCSGRSGFHISLPSLRTYLPPWRLALHIYGAIPYKLCLQEGMVPPDLFIQYSHFKIACSPNLTRIGSGRALCDPNAKQPTCSGIVAKTYQRDRRCSQSLPFACRCI